VAAIAAVALVAGGTTYALSRGGEQGGKVPESSGPPPHSGRPGPAGVVLHTDADNRAYTQALVHRLTRQLVADAPKSATRATADQVAPLKKLTSFSGPYGGTYGVNASLFWLVPGDAKELARWYADHPLPGFHADGRDPDEGPDGGIGGSSLADGGWSNDVFFYAPGDDSVQGGAGIQVQTTQMGDHTGVRATIFGTWYPARPVASYADGIRSVTVTLTVTKYRRHSSSRSRTWTVADGSRLRRIQSTYNGLAGAVPFFHSCPMQREARTYRVVMHTRDGDLVAHAGIGCYDWLKVFRDGVRVGPLLTPAHSLVAELGRGRPR
jgi:hypothetical protein